MRKTFVMTALATVLAFQVAAADNVKSTSKEEMSAQKQHSLARTPQQVSHEVSKMRKGPKVSLDSVIDFQFVMPKNADRYKYARGNSYVNRLYTAANGALVSDPSAIVSGDPVITKDHDAGILGDYSKDYYYDVNALINFKIEQVLANSMSVGGVLEVLTPVSSARLRDYSVGAKSKGAYMFVKAPYFKVQAGAMVGAEQMLKIDPASWSASDGGITSGWINYANLEGNYIDATDHPTATSTTRHRDVLRPFYVTPALYSEYVSNDATFSRNDDVSIAPKVGVYSNNINGFKFGASYAPHHVTGKSNVSGVVSSSKLSPVYDNVIGFGARYEKELKDYVINLAVAGETGDTPKENKDNYYNLLAVSVGGTVKYGNMIALGAEYGHLGQSGLSKTVIKDEDLNKASSATSPSAVTDPYAYYWTIGGAYDIGPARVSANYYTSVKNMYSKNVSADEGTLEDFNVGAHYNFSYGSKHTQFTPYVTYHHFTTKERVAKSAAASVVNSEDNNKGNVLMVGVKAIF